MTMSGRPRCSATSKTVTTFGVADKRAAASASRAKARSRVVLARVPVREQLHSDRPLEHGVGRAVHLAHPAVRDQLGRGVSPRKNVAGDQVLVPERARLDTV